MKISITLATYIGAQYLRAQLDSLSSQSGLPDELIICNDASCDETVSRRPPKSKEYGVQSTSLIIGTSKQRRLDLQRASLENAKDFEISIKNPFIKPELRKDFYSKGFDISPGPCSYRFSIIPKGRIRRNQAPKRFR